MKKLFPVLLAVMFLVPAITAKADTPAEQRAAIQKMETDILDQLYKERPDTRREIAEAEGYAVFSTGELALMWFSGGYGHGVAHNNKTGEHVYMQMAKAGVGIGLGAKDVNTVFVFHNASSLREFIHTGLDLSGSADASVKAGEKGDAIGGSANVLPGVRIYQLTDTGLMAQAMLQGTRYWKDEDLNRGNPNPDLTQHEPHPQAGMR